MICNEEEIKIMVLTNINFFDYQKKKRCFKTRDSKGRGSSENAYLISDLAPLTSSSSVPFPTPFSPYFECLSPSMGKNYTSFKEKHLRL